MSSTVSQHPQDSIYFGVFYWKRSRLIKKRPRHSCFPVDCVKCFKNTYFDGPLPPTSTGRPPKILFDRPGDFPIWHPRDVAILRPGDVLNWRPVDVLIWRSRDVPGRLIRDIPRTFSGRPLEYLESTQTWMSNFFFNFSFRTYSIDQI